MRDARCASDRALISRSYARPMGRAGLIDIQCPHGLRRGLITHRVSRIAHLASRITSRLNPSIFADLADGSRSSYLTRTPVFHPQEPERDVQRAKSVPQPHDLRMKEET